MIYANQYTPLAKIMSRKAKYSLNTKLTFITFALSTEFIQNSFDSRKT